MIAGYDWFDDADIVSFDVFDTLVHRLCGSPESLFVWLGRTLRARDIVDIEAETFARLRVTAEEAVWDWQGGLDSHVHLTDIHAELARRLGMPPQVAARLASEELQLEARCLRPNPLAVKLMQAAIATRRRVIAVSDTYLTGAEIADLLRPLGILPPDGIFTSHDVAASKKSGRLYRHVTQQLGVEPGRFLHLGDKLGVDVRQAQASGWRALSMPQGRLTRHELALVEARWESGGLSSALSGASRAARLTSRTTEPRDTAMVAVGASPAAVLVIGYVLWILERAQEKGLDRLAFLARDGQILARVAEILVRRLQIPIQVMYLHVSRQSTNLAGTYELGSEDLGWILRHAEQRRVDDILTRVDLSAASLSGLDGDLDGTDRVSGETRQRLAELLASPPITERVLERARARRSLLRRYLTQSGLLGQGGRSGIVDLGGVGSQVRSLYQILVAEGEAAPQIFLLGLDEHADPDVREAVRAAPWLLDTECWIYDAVRQVGEPRYPGLVTFAHICCGADHQSVTGYELHEDVVIPTFNQAAEDPLGVWGQGRFQEPILEVAERIVLDPDLVQRDADLRTTLRRSVECLWKCPSRREAEVFGSFPFEAGEMDASEIHAIARPYSAVKVLVGTLDGTFPQRSWNSWHEASVQLSPPYVRGLVRMLEGAYRILLTSDLTVLRQLVKRVRKSMGT